MNSTDAADGYLAADDRRLLISISRQELEFDALA
jgi:hypothetical protein